MSQHGKTRVRERAITALLSTNTLSEAAAQAGISKRTLLRWLREADFRASYLRTKADALRTATAILTRNSAHAAQVLDEILGSGPMPHQGARVSAATATIRLSLDAFVLENLDERLRKLEAQSDEP